MSVIETIAIGALFVWAMMREIRITRLEANLQTMNAIVKRLQARAGMRADGIDKVR